MNRLPSNVIFVFDFQQQIIKIQIQKLLVWAVYFYLLSLIKRSEDTRIEMNKF